MRLSGFDAWLAFAEGGINRKDLASLDCLQGLGLAVFAVKGLVTHAREAALWRLIADFRRLYFDKLNNRTRRYA